MGAPGSEKLWQKTAANGWLKRRMKEIESAGDDLSSIRNKGKTLADAFERNTRERGTEGSNAL